MSAPKIDSGIFLTNIGIFGGNGGIVSPGPGNSGGSYNYTQWQWCGWLDVYSTPLLIQKWYPVISAKYRWKKCEFLKIHEVQKWLNWFVYST